MTQKGWSVGAEGWLPVGGGWRKLGSYPWNCGQRVVFGSPQRWVVTGLQTREPAWRLETASGALVFAYPRRPVTFIAMVSSKLEPPMCVGLAYESHPTTSDPTKPLACEPLPLSR